MLGFAPTAAAPIGGGSTSGREAASVYAPFVQAAGATVKGNKKAISPAWPTHQAYDVGFLIIQAKAGETVTLPTAATFVEVAGSPFNAGGGAQLSVFWARATSAGMSSPTTSKPLDHLLGQIVTVRGAARVGNPWDAIAGGTKLAPSTALSIPGMTAAGDDRLLFAAIASEVDTTADFASAEANADLAMVAEDTDTSTTLGVGGGLATFHGTRNFAGVFGASSLTVLNGRNAYFAALLKPPVDVIATVTGLTASATLNPALVITGIGRVNPDRVTAAAQLGQVAIAGDANVAVSGLSASCALGAVETQTGISVTLAGLSASADLGSVITDNITATPIVGLSAVAQLGQVTVLGERNVAIDLDSLSASTALGAVTPSTSVAVDLGALEAAAQLGAVDASGTSGVVSVSVMLAGLVAAAELGTLAFSIDEEEREVTHVVQVRRGSIVVVDVLRQVIDAEV